MQTKPTFTGIGEYEMMNMNMVNMKDYVYDEEGCVSLKFVPLPRHVYSLYTQTMN